MKLQKKLSLAQKRRWRIRKKVQGSAARPRLTVHFSNKHIYAQCIDDVKGHTLAYVSSVGGKDAAVKANSEGAVTLGKAIAEKARAAGIESVVFDRAGRRYHGCVKSFAEAAREGGLQF
ncbi:MAG: 50S ribosomal protein L18 [Opitutales bacterium]